MILVSACLVGLNCRYNGKSSSNNFILDLVKEGRAIPICPEQLGGLSTPRVPAEQIGQRIFGKDGSDLTIDFQRGVIEALKFALLINCKKAILKSKSPTCGTCKVYDGTFSNTLVDGDGMFASALKNAGIEVLSEKDI